MKQLNEFLTLEAAQAYTYVKYTDITAGKAGQFFGITGLLDVLEANFNNVTAVQVTPELPMTTIGSLCRTITRSAESTGFASDPATDAGFLNRAGSGALVTEGIIDPQLEESFWKLGEEIVAPYVNTTQQEFDEAHDSGEIIELPVNNGQHKVTLAITTQPSKPTTIKLQQRFGTDAADLTEWHDVGSITVFYRQRNYSSGLIPAAPTPIRELRAVSPLTLGVGLPEYPESTEI